MFILKKETVENCQLQIKNTIVSGVKYLNRPFIRGEAYKKTQKKEAIQRAREFLDSGKFCIILEDSNFYSLWHVAPQEFIVGVQETSLEPEFLSDCQKELAHYIGPMAKLVCEEVLSKASTSLTRQDYIQALAKKISDRKQAKQFLKRLGENK